MFARALENPRLITLFAALILVAGGAIEGFDGFEQTALFPLVGGYAIAPPTAP